MNNTDFSLAFICPFTVDQRYAYAIASALHGVRHILRKDFMIQVIYISAYPDLLSHSLSNKDILASLKLCLTNIEIIIFQPPWDLKVGKTFIIHYTYGCDYTLEVTKLYLHLVHLSVTLLEAIIFTSKTI